MLNLNDSVYAFASYDNIHIDRGYVTRLHDDYVEIFSLINKRKEWYKRERVVSTKKLNQSHA